MAFGRWFCSREIPDPKSELVENMSQGRDLHYSLLRIDTVNTAGDFPVTTCQENRLEGISWAK